MGVEACDENTLAQVEDNMATDSAQGTDEASRNKKAEDNRKKRERQKAKKKAKAAATDPAPTEASEEDQKESGTGARTGFHAEGEIQALAATTMRSERRDAGEGRGLGMFATELIEPRAVVAAAAPALSVVFDSAAMTTCGFCFDTVEHKQPGELSEVVVRANVVAEGEVSFGVILDDAEGGGVVVRGFAPKSVNLGRGEDALEMGDKIVQIGGKTVSGDKQAVATALKAAATAALNSEFITPPCTDSATGSTEVRLVELACKVERPSCVPCMSCRCFSACRKCVKAGRLQWHRHECSMFCKLPASCKAGSDTSVLRMLLRYRASLTEGVGEWSDEKERTPLVMLTLQKNECKVAKQQLSALSRLTGVREEETAAIIYAIRTNACEIHRREAKVGCALSALMGWHNHDCAPNAMSRIGDDGLVRIETLRPIALGEEVLISYVDPTQPVDTRRAILDEHYGFRCNCARCRNEQRRALKSRVPKQQGR